ncbi:hypothetical protein L7F22_051050 [Adiantum nelumboides]|nr:hypothetical protein [Adiantum nelumboides]
MSKNMQEEERQIDFGTLDLQNDVASPDATWAIDFLAHKLQEAMANTALQATTEEEERASAPPSPATLVVVSFYKFAHLPDYQSKRQPLKELCEDLRVSGGIILASEGINGSICGTRDAVEKVLKNIESDERLIKLRRTESPATDEEEEFHHGHTEKSPLGAGNDAPFRWGHARVKLKNEIVTLGIPEVSPAEQVGKYVSPKEWNSLIQEDGTISGC